ncbi:hypothetical protein [Massilimicrobiota sp. An134]|uniref:hypothetical protein n=1 Tax=Massilimicrobiota sp. An134 TaxID=1965557 RepID=UPI000B389312|nr:hypothetical protein [Massilimicrobiota sp. An134]OUQ25248.1 hypothetical protein B5E79_12080 [Massilimicrobiota sp. An134]
MSKKGEIKAFNAPGSKTKAESIDVSYLERNIVLDFSFPYLFYFVNFNDFTNKFRTPKQYIEYFDYMHKILFASLSKTKCKNLFDRRDENFRKHSHVISDSKQINLIKNIIKSLYIANGLPEGKADSWIEQNIGDAYLWQIGLANEYGRVIGYFQENIFKIILFDPHHLIYKTEKGSIRKYKDVSTFTFFPDKIKRFTFPKKCIRCGATEKLNSRFDDAVIKKEIYICDNCLLEILDYK